MAEPDKRDTKTPWRTIQFLPDTPLSQFDRYDLRRKSVVNDNEHQHIVNEFKLEFDSKKQKFSALIVNSTSAPNNWTIAGFNDAGQFKIESINDTNNELSVELKKVPANESKISKLVASILGRTYFEFDDAPRSEPVADQLARQLIDFIQSSAGERNPNKLHPPRIGVFGGLGQGKTTVIRWAVSRQLLCPVWRQL